MPGDASGRRVSVFILLYMSTPVSDTADIGVWVRSGRTFSLRVAVGEAIECDVDICSTAGLLRVALIGVAEADDFLSSTGSCRIPCAAAVCNAGLA